MKNNFLFNCIVIMLFSIFSISSNAQTTQGQPQPRYSKMQFSYDAAGNRIRREYIPLRLMSDTASNEQVAQIAQQHGISVYPNPTVEGNAVQVVISSLGIKERKQQLFICLITPARCYSHGSNPTLLPRRLI